MLNCPLIPYTLAVFVKGANEHVLLQLQYMCKKNDMSESINMFNL